MSSFGKFVSNSVVPETVDVFGILNYEPTERQRAFHDASAERIDAILYGGAAGGGKELDINSTSIPTPDGFKLLKDIHAGDTIFGRDGKPYEVLKESPVHYHEGYELTFDDGSAVIVNDEHLWLTFDAKELAQLTRLDPEWRERRQAKRSSRAGNIKSIKFSEALKKRNSERDYEYKDVPTGTVRTTAEIVATLKTPDGRNNHAVPVCGTLEMPERILPIDPYVLGAWLGDGYSGSGRICGIDDEIFEKCSKSIPVKSNRFERNLRVVTFDGLSKQLKELNLLANKHVPAKYLFTSAEQRLELLRGLMDTDGNCLKNGTVEFANTNKDITEAVAFLARSFGHKVSVREFRTKLDGKDCGPAWRVKFRAKVQVFSLTRKAERLEPFLDKERRTTNFRYIVSAERVGKRDMKCLKVSSPDHLFLVTENLIPTHNTAAFLMDALWNAANFPGMRIGCFRRSYPELEESFLSQLAKWNYGRDLGAKWNSTNKVLKFNNGSIINFTYAENLVDASRILGGEYQAFYIDEASQMLPAVIQHIEERLRSGNKLVPVIGLRLATNPGGVGHKYLKDRFINPTKRGKIRYTEKVGESSRGRTVAFIQAKVTDNPHVNEGYQAVLDAIPDPRRRAAMRDGDWDAMVGQFFEQWQYAKHVVLSFNIPKEWPRYAGIDYGYAAPFACVWIAVDNDGRVWVYREICVSGIQADGQAKLILEAERSHGELEVIRVADPSMWGSRGTPMSIADIYGIEGCGITKADNDRINGWSRVHQFLNDGPSCDIHRAEGKERCPMLHVFEDKCPQFIETIPALPRSQAKPDDAETRNVEDHIADALRYVIMAAGTYARPIIYDREPTFKTGVPDTMVIVEEEDAPALQQPNFGNMFVGDLGLSPF